MYQSITRILNEVKREIIQQYKAKNIMASGRFGRNMTVARNGRYKVVLTIPHYSEYIMRFKSNKGGFKGWWPPSDVLVQWIKDKGLQLRDFSTGRFKAKTETNYKQAAYLIGRKIAEQGTDIYTGKREPIDLDRIINDRLDYAGNELGDRILQQMKL